MTTSPISLVTMSVEDLAAKPYVQRAISSPMQVKSVLTFFFGLDYFNNEYVYDMRDGIPLEIMIPLWVTKNDEYDKLCQNFISVVRTLSKEQNDDKEGFFFHPSSKEEISMVNFFHPTSLF